MFSKFSAALLASGFSQTKADYSLFTKGSGSSFVALLVYVDDILITGPSPDIIASVKADLGSHFQLKDLGTAKYFLGLELSRSSHGIYLSQRKYCLQILENFGFLGARSASYPMTPDLKLSTSSGAVLSLEDATAYHRLVGRLLYLQIYDIHSLSTTSVNFSNDLVRVTWLLSIICFATSNVLLVRELCFVHPLLFNSRLLLMLIGVLV